MRNHSCISESPFINFLEHSKKKSGEILHLKKRRLSEYVTKVIKNLFSNAIFKTLIENGQFIIKKKS